MSRLQVDLLVQTPTIYYDSDAVSVYIALSPPDYGAYATETVKMVLSLGSESKTIGCGSVSTLKGVQCTKSLDADWFSSENQTMEVYATVTGTNAVSTTHSIVLHAVPDFTRTSSVVWLHVPSYPMLAGTTFTTTLFANTTNARGKADSLSTWSIDVPHDDGLTYVSNSVDSDLYDITVNDADGVLSAVATYKTAFSSSDRKSVV